MKELEWYTNEVTNESIKYGSEQILSPLLYKYGHLYLEWLANLVLFTRLELNKLHRRFAHPTSEKFYKFLQRHRPKDTASEAFRILQISQQLLNHVMSCLASHISSK